MQYLYSLNTNNHLMLNFFSVECVAGSYNVNGDGKCKLCPKASFVDREGSTECLLCGEGFTTSQTGSTSDYQCVNIVGKYFTSNRFLQKLFYLIQLSCWIAMPRYKFR